MRHRATVLLSLVVVALALVAVPTATTKIGEFFGLKFTADAKTIATNGTSTPQTYTLTPKGSYVTVTNGDPDGATITMGEPFGFDGVPVTIVNIGSNPITFSYSSGVSELAGTIKLAQYDWLCEFYAGDRWIGCGFKSVYAPMQLTASIHQTNAQIIAWPTTGDIEVVPASSGFSQVPLWAMLVCDSTAANYTNLTGSSLGITTNNNSGYGTVYLDESSSGGGKVSDLLATGDLTQVTLAMYARVDVGASLADLLSAPIPAASYNGNITMRVVNGSGNFTGGSGSNTGCDITVGYLRIKVPGL